MAWTEHVEGKVHLISESTPICNREGFWKPSNTGEEVILASPNFSFCQIGAVDVGWGVFELSALLVNEVFCILRYLVVHLVELQFESTCCEVSIHSLVHWQELFFCPAFDGDGFYKISILDVEDDKVFDASVGRDGEPALLIAE
jgi:hypothetical protein